MIFFNAGGCGLGYEPEEGEIAQFVTSGVISCVVLAVWGESLVFCAHLTNIDNLVTIARKITLAFSTRGFAVQGWRIFCTENIGSSTQAINRVGECDSEWPGLGGNTTVVSGGLVPVSSILVNFNLGPGGWNCEGSSGASVVNAAHRIYTPDDAPEGVRVANATGLIAALGLYDNPIAVPLF